jgi:hypothetical protein
MKVGCIRWTTSVPECWGGQCVQFHIERPTIFPDDSGKREYSYVWINQQFILDKRSILDEATMSDIRAAELEHVDTNTVTGTVIYKK